MPTDFVYHLLFVQAFTALLSQFGAAAATNRTLVAGLLAGHIVPFPIFSSQLRNGQQLPTLAGYNLTVSINGSVVTIIAPGSHALVIAANITGGASVAHLVDAVLLPPAPAPTPSPSPPPPKSLYDIVSANNQTTILKQLVDLAGAPFNTTLKNTSAAVTVFAPVDAVSVGEGACTALQKLADNIHRQCTHLLSAIFPMIPSYHHT
jgi:uncharacterized surface protein with fasciclin (FAS1) repeats